MHRAKHGRVPEIRVKRLWDTGPFDIIGDVHGCFVELVELLGKLGYGVEPAPDDPGGWELYPPARRKVIFVGDLVDRGPRIADVLRLAMRAVETEEALCVIGNHDDKLMRKLQGHNVQIKHGLEDSLAQLAASPPGFSGKVRSFLERLPSHYVLDGGRLVVAHAGLKEELQGHGRNQAREFALYGDTAGGRRDEHGLPIRYNWGARYQGNAAVIYGHTPVLEPEWQNNTIDIDTGCVFGGALTALRWPERELVSVPARQIYSEPSRPMQRSIRCYPTRP